MSALRALSLPLVSTRFQVVNQPIHPLLGEVMRSGGVGSSRRDVPRGNPPRPSGPPLQGGDRERQYVASPTRPGGIPAPQAEHPSHTHTEIGLMYKLERLIDQREKRQELAHTIVVNTLKYLGDYLIAYDKETGPTATTVSQSPRLPSQSPAPPAKAVCITPRCRPSIRPSPRRSLS